MYYPSNNQNHQKFTFSPNWKSPHKKACRPTKRTNTDGIPFTPKNPSQPLRRETNTTCTLTTTRATTTIANRASASTPFATRGTSVRSRAFSSHFFYLTFFFCSVCDAALFSFYSLSLSLSVCVCVCVPSASARYSAFLSLSHACDLLAFLFCIERQGRISSNCKSSWRATLAE
jgi:hypothetical protein